MTGPRRRRDDVAQKLADGTAQAEWDALSPEQQAEICPPERERPECVQYAKVWEDVLVDEKGRPVKFTGVPKTRTELNTWLAKLFRVGESQVIPGFDPAWPTIKHVLQMVMFGMVKDDAGRGYFCQPMHIKPEHGGTKSVWGVRSHDTVRRTMQFAARVSGLAILHRMVEWGTGSDRKVVRDANLYIPLDPETGEKWQFNAPPDPVLVEAAAPDAPATASPEGKKVRYKRLRAAHLARLKGFVDAAARFVASQLGMVARNGGVNFPRGHVRHATAEARPP
jgi:hypothetical protein